MLDLDTRTAILKLHAAGHGKRTIAEALKVSRNAVRRVLRSGQSEVPRLERPEQLGPHVDVIRELTARCKGNLIRVWEELQAQGIETSYSSLTDFCRRHELRETAKKKPVGRYFFGPGEEMQHDTSPHRIALRRRTMTVQCASLVLCYSRAIYAQVYPRWNRFACRIFVDEALRYFGGAASRCMLDNSTVIIASGSGPSARPADEMRAFAARFGFEFVAHRVGDANRSARVERPFHHIENNFYAGRDFDDIDDVNAQLRGWCDRLNHAYRRSLKTSAVELLAVERPTLRPLPLHLPEVYDLHRRRVDVEGFINLHTNRYSVEPRMIGRPLDIRETKDRVRIFDGHRLVVDHERRPYGAGERITHPEHRRSAARRRARKAEPPSAEEALLRRTDPVLGTLCDRLRKRYGGQARRPIRQLHRIFLDYPTEAVLKAARQAATYDLFDPGRIERIVLQVIAGDFFLLPDAVTHGDLSERSTSPTDPTLATATDTDTDTITDPQTITDPHTVKEEDPDA